MTKRTHIWILRTLVFVGLLTPLLFIPSFAFPFQNGKWMWLFIIITISLPWLGLSLTTNNVARQQLKDPLIITTALMLLAWALSGFMGVDPLASWQGSVERADGLFTWIILFLWMLGTSVAFTKDHFTKKHAIWVVLSVSGIVGMIATLEWLGLFSFGNTQHGGVVATLGNPNFLGATLLLPFFWSLGHLAQHKKKQTYLFIAISIFCLAGILLSESRGAYLGLAAGTLALLGNWLLSKRITLQAHWTGVILTTLGAVFVGIIALTPETLRELLSLAGNSGMTRSYYWQYAVEGWKNAPLLGIGFQNFHVVANELYEPALYTVHHFDTWPDRVHNQFLELLVTTGLVGTGLYLALWSQLLTRTWKRPFVFAGLIAIGAQLLFSLDTITVMLMWMFVIAMISTEKTTPDNTHVTSPHSKLIFASGTMISLLIIAIVVPGRLNAYQNSQTNTLVETQFGSAHLAQAHASETLTSITTLTEDQLAQQVSHTRNQFQQNTEHHPLRAQYWYEWAVFETELARMTATEVSEYGYKAVSRVEELAPNRIEATVLRAGMHYHQEEYTQALTLLDTAIAVSPVDVQGRLLRAQVYTLTNQIDKALDDYYVLIEHAWWHPDIQNEELLRAVLLTFPEFGKLEYIPLTAQRLIELNPALEEELTALVQQLGL